MSTIIFPKMMYALTVASLRSAIDQIDSSLVPTDKGETNVQALKRFEELYEQLGNLIKEYKELLELDQEAVEKAGLTMQLQDLEIGNLFK